MDPLIWLYLALLAAVAALALAAFFAKQVNAASPGNETMVELMVAIREGAMAFIKREYTAVAVFVAIMTGLILIFLDWGSPLGRHCLCLRSGALGVGRLHRNAYRNCRQCTYR